MSINNTKKQYIQTRKHTNRERKRTIIQTWYKAG